MTKTLRSISFLLLGMLLFSACTEEETGKSPEKIADKIDVDVEDVVQDTIPSDSVDVEEPIAPPPPPPPIPPSTPEPEPDPIVHPEPWPEPEPILVPPPPMDPEPVQMNPVVDFPDVEAVYPGDSPGNAKEMMKFITENIRYPQVDLEAGNQGRVYVQFIVEKDGSLTNVEVMRGISPTLDREAKRVIRIMPKWKPGKAGGKVVRTRMRLPISFRLD